MMNKLQYAIELQPCHMFLQNQVQKSMSGYDSLQSVSRIWHAKYVYDGLTLSSRQLNYLLEGWAELDRKIKRMKKKIVYLKRSSSFLEG